MAAKHNLNICLFKTMTDELNIWITKARSMEKFSLFSTKNKKIFSTKALKEKLGHSIEIFICLLHFALSSNTENFSL
jgi:hypothetical protein